MANTVNYADSFSNTLRELYGQELKSADLFDSNQDLQIINSKNLKIPRLSVSGYKDHTRGSLGFNTGNYSNDFDTVSLDHDRDIEFAVDPMDVDETNLVLEVAKIHNRFEKTQAVPELDCYVFSKLYAVATAGGVVPSEVVLTTANVLSDFDDKLSEMEDAGVPLDRVILYCTPQYKKLLKEAEGITRMLNVSGSNGIDRRVHSIDDIKKIVTVPSARFKTLYNFTDGYQADATGTQINYMLVDPEAQVSRVKYSYIKMFTPGSDSRTADNYLYQNRRYNGTFAIPDLVKEGIKINVTATE